MKKVTRTVTRTVLIADEGMVLTNGKNYGKEVYLGVGADESAWCEVSEAEYEAAMAEDMTT